MRRRKVSKSSDLGMLQGGSLTSKDAEWLRELERENMQLKKIASELMRDNLTISGNTGERSARRFH